MPIVADRVKDSTTTTGTGNATLSGTAPSGFRTFASALGSGSVTVPYCIQNTANGEWEVGEGTFNGTTTLSRDVVRSSSNAGALVNFAAGTKDVFLTANAEMLSNSGKQLAMASGQAWA